MRSLWLLVVVAGVSCVVYAAAFHAVTVTTEKEVEAPPPPLPTMPERLPWESPGGMPGMAGADPWATPVVPEPPPAITVEFVPIELREPAVVKDVTVGGLARTGSGGIRRTYSGKAPAACPT